MSIFDSQNYQRATGQEPTGLMDWAFANYDAAANGTPNFTPESTPISVPGLNTNAYKNAQANMDAPYVDKLYADAPATFPSFGRGSLAAVKTQAPTQINVPTPDQYTNAYGTASNEMPVPANAKAVKTLKKATAPAKTKKQKAKRGAARAAVTKAENKAVVQAGRKQNGVHEALMGIHAGDYGGYGAAGPQGAYGYNKGDLDIMNLF